MSQAGVLELEADDQEVSSYSTTYSCGCCGYALNLTSTMRINVPSSVVGSTYQKKSEKKKDIISFHSIDISRFTQVDEISCFPYVWGLHRIKTKLLCRSCGTHIGHGYAQSATLCGFDFEANLSSHPTKHTRYAIKLKALQPSDLS